MGQHRTRGKEEPAASRNQKQRGIDECEACKSAMCLECDAVKRADKAKQDWESVWEELQHTKRELQSVKRSRAQVKGTHSRALWDLWAKDNRPVRGE